MSYLVIARKYRPEVFMDVAGQEHVTRSLSNAVFSDKVGHAFLFAGPRGVGKTTTARILTKAINCLNRKGSDPCNECRSCREISSGQCMDVLEIDGASNRGIDDIRELRENIRYSPSSVQYKVYIIDEVHMVTREAFNALLKTLEEPPAHGKFILATTEIHKVPATILSRCQRYEFRRIDVATIFKSLKDICEKESIRISDKGLKLIARMADGSMRDGQSLLDQVIAYCGEQIDDESILMLLGKMDPDLLNGIVQSIIRGDAARVIETFSRFIDSGGDIQRFVPELIEYVRDLMVIKVSEKSFDIIERDDAEIAGMRKSAASVDIDRLSLYFRMLSTLDQEIKRSESPRLIIDAALIQLCRMKELESLDSVLQRLDSLPAQAVNDNSSKSETGRMQSSASLQNSGPTKPPVRPASHSGDVAKRAVSEDKPPLKEDAEGALKTEAKRDEPAEEDTEGEDRLEVMEGEAAEKEDEDIASFDRDSGKVVEKLEKPEDPMKALEQIVKRVGKGNVTLSTALKNCALRWTEDGAEIVFDENGASFYQQYLKSGNSLKIVRNCLSEYLGDVFRLSVVTQKEKVMSLQRMSEQEKKKHSRELKEEALKDPMIKKIVDVFNAKIIEVREN